MSITYCPFNPTVAAMLESIRQSSLRSAAIETRALEAVKARRVKMQDAQKDGEA